MAWHLRDGSLWMAIGMQAKRLAKPFRNDQRQCVHERSPWMASGFLRKPKLDPFRILVRQKISIDLSLVSMFPGQSPKSAGIHDDRTADAKMSPEQTPLSGIDRLPSHHGCEFDLLRKAGKRPMKHRILQYQRHQRRNRGRHRMTKSCSQRIA